MSIQDKITRLQNAKTDIAEAITAAGGTVAEGDGFEEFSSDIGTISSGITLDESYDISEGKLNTATVALEGDVTAHIPDGVTTISNNAFMNNEDITKVIIPNSVLTVEDGYSMQETVGTFVGCKNLTDIVFSENLTKIASYMFIRCTGLTSITIPDSVTSIGNGAFEGCDALTDIYYTGTQSEWNTIDRINYAGIPAGATIHYEYTPE